MNVSISSYGKLLNQVALQNLDLDTTCIFFDAEKGEGGEIGLASRNVREAELTDDDIRNNILVRSQLMNCLAGDAKISRETLLKAREMLFGSLSEGKYSSDEAGKPLTARVFSSVMALVNGGVSQTGKAVVDMVRDDMTMNEDIEGRLEEIVSTMVETGVGGAERLRESATRIRRFYADFLKSTGTKVLGDADFDRRVAEYFDMAEDLRELAMSGKLDSRQRRIEVFDLCEKLTLRGSRLTRIRDDLALNRGDDGLTGCSMSRLIRSVIPKGDGGDAVLEAVLESARKFTDISRKVNSFLDGSLADELKQIGECAKGLGELREELLKAFGGKPPAPLSRTGRYLSLLAELKSRLDAVGKAVENGGDAVGLLQDFARGTMLRGLLSGKLDIDAYLRARRLNIGHGMIDTRYDDGNLRDRNSDRLGSGHENTVYKGRFADKATGDEGTLAVKDRDSANREVYGPRRLKFLSGETQDSLKANFYCSQAATALGVRGRVPVVYGVVRREKMEIDRSELTDVEERNKTYEKVPGRRNRVFVHRDKVKIGMNVVRGQSLGDRADGTEHMRVHEFLTCETVEPGNPRSKKRSLAEIRGKERNDIRGDLMGQMNELDWVDMLSGEQGRHERNFMFDITSRGARVYGIDNDKSFLKGCVGYGKYRISVGDVVNFVQRLTSISVPPFSSNFDLVKFGFGCDLADAEELKNGGVVLAKILKTLDPDHFADMDRVTSADSDRMVEIDYSKLKRRNANFLTIFRPLTHVNSMRKPSFIRQSMLDRLLAMDKGCGKRKEYLDSLEGIGADELEAAELRLDDAISLAKSLKEKGRVIDDVSRNEGESEMLFRRVDVQRKVDGWHIEDRVSHMDETMRELKELADALLPVYKKRIETRYAKKPVPELLAQNWNFLTSVRKTVAAYDVKRSAYGKAVAEGASAGDKAVTDFFDFCRGLRKRLGVMIGEDFLLSSFDAFFNGFELDEIAPRDPVKAGEAPATTA